MEARTRRTPLHRGKPRRGLLLGLLLTAMLFCSSMVGLALAATDALTTGPASAAGSPPLVTCTSDPNNFNTGYNGDGGFLPDGSLDANWEVAGPFPETSPLNEALPPPDDATYVAAIVAPNEAYSASPYGNAQWISQTSNDVQVPNDGDWYYRYEFDLDPSVDAATLSLDMDFLADNEIAEVYVNGVAQSTQTTGLPQGGGANTLPATYNYEGFITADAAATVLDHNWKTGLNTIVVQMKSGEPDEAFDAQLRPSDVCPAQTLDLEKFSETRDFTGADQTITYEYEVTNISDETVNGLAITDTMIPSGITCDLTTLASEATTTCTGTYTTTATDVTNGKVANTAWATGSECIDNGPDSGAEHPASTTCPVVESNSATATVPLAALNLVKTASVTAFTAAGQPITYTYTVTNTGGTIVGDIGITDNKVASPDITCLATILAVGASTTCSGTYSTTSSDVTAGEVTNVATASGEFCENEDLARVEAKLRPAELVCDTPAFSSNTATATVPLAALTVAKSVTSVDSSTMTPFSYSKVGDTIAYAFLVTNTGGTAITNISVDDTDATADPTTIPVTCGQSTLAAQASETCTATYTVTQADIDNGSVSDSATASGTLPGTTTKVTTAQPSTATVPATQTTTLTILKSVTSVDSSTVTPFSYSKVGDTIAYAFVVTNTGNVTLSNISVADTDATADPTAIPVTCDQSTLAPKASETCTATYTVTQADIDNGAVSDSATASATPPQSTGKTSVSSSPSTATVPAAQTAAITVVKSVTSVDSSTVTPFSYSKVGDTIAYAFLVTNTGNVTLSNISVADTDATADPTTIPVTCDQSTLAPQASETCTATYTVTQADLDNGAVSDSATASATPPESTGKSSVTSALPSTATVPAAQTAAITVVKSVTSVDSSTVTPFSYSKVGDTIAYGFLVTNTGNVTLSNISVDDTDATADPTTIPVTCGESTLAPKASETCTATYTVTQADLDNGAVSDSATASATPPQSTGESSVTSALPSTATVPAVQTPAITVVKSSTTSSFSRVGDTIDYDFLVTNTGNVTLTNVSVTDSEASPATQANLTGPACPQSTLAPAASETCTATYTVTKADLDNGSVTDSATASGTPPQSTGESSVTSPGSSVTVQALAAEVTLRKSASTLTPDAHGDDTFTLTASNAGPSSSGRVVVTDVLASGLAYVSSKSVTGSVTVSGQKVTWTIPDLGATGQTSTAALSIVVSVDTTSHVSNTATFSQTTPNENGATTGKSDTVNLTPSYAVLAVRETVSDPRPVIGAEDHFTTTVTNEGPDTADDVVVTDPLPAGVKYLSADPSQGSGSAGIVNGAEVLMWHVGTLAVGASASIDVIVTITASSGSLVNPVTATDSTFDPTGQQKKASATAIVATPVVIPPTHTGEPWSGLSYWLLVLLLGLGGSVMFETGRRARRRAAD